MLILVKILNFKRYSSISNFPVLHPWFVTGLIDAEGCFNIMITKSSSVLGWRVQARFILELHIKDIKLLYQLQSFFFKNWYCFY